MRTALTFALLLLSLTASAAETRRYTVLHSDRPSGAQVTSVGADGRISVDYSYRDNARGPDLKELIELDAQGLPIRYQVSGKSTFGAPVNETFSRRGDRVQWRSSSDHGTTTVAGTAVYVPVEASPEMRALITRAVARQPGGRIAALPSGQLVAQQLTTTELESGDRTVGIALYSLSGVMTRPSLAWLTADDEQRFFASVVPGIRRVMEKGFESQGPALEALQVKAEGELLQRLAGRLTHRLAEPILIRNVRPFDSQNARLLAPADVYVSGGRIAAIYEAGSTPREAATVIDGAGRVLLPALFDMHTHEDPWNLLLQTAGGVTTSRDMGSDNAALAEIIAQVDRGEFVGPRILPAGYIEGESEFASRGGFVVKDLQEAKDAIDWYAQRGFRQVKLYNSFRPEWVEPTAAYAHQRGVRVSGHIPAFMRAEQAVRAGYDEIQHINQVTLNFLVKPEDDTRTLARFTLIGEHAHKLDLDSQRVKEFIALLKERGTVIDPTLATFEAMFNQKQGEMNPSFAAIADHVPIGQQREWRTNSMDVTAENVAKYRESYQRLLEFTALMHRAGIPLVAGTDEIAGFTLHRELELYVEAGIPAAEALRIATWNGATYCGMGDRLGSIERGKSADLILVEGDPTQNISDIRRVSLVLKEGVAYYPAEVFEAVGVKRFVDPPGVKVAEKK